MPLKKTPIALSIAASDSGCGAGIQADLLTFHALNVFGTTAITCITAQNPNSITHIEPITPESLNAQLSQIHAYFSIGAIKIGMLWNVPLMKIVHQWLPKFKAPIVIDPIEKATEGSLLTQISGWNYLQKNIFPQATLLTPNTDEAGNLANTQVTSLNQTEIAIQLANRYQTAVLLKGGHIEHQKKLFDVLARPHQPSVTFSAQKSSFINTHGSGCRLSSAIAAYLSKGFSLTKSVAKAHCYLQKNIHTPIYLNQTAFIKNG
jgi:hydroxymethylpyrimidine/phosphomethylpyrimidine kinase